MKILLGGFHQEINTFAPGTTTYEQFRAAGSAMGDDMLRLAASNVRYFDSRDALRAEYQEIVKAGGEVVSGGYMLAQAGAIIEDHVLKDYIKSLFDTIERNLPLDGVFLVLHGAAQTTASEDPEGDIVKAVRDAVGERAVIAVASDLHSDVTPKWVENVNIICGYHTYPHVDIFETGCRAAKLGLRMLKEGLVPHMACVNIPMLIPPSEYTTNTPPLSGLMQYGKSLVESGELLDFSAYLMQAWLDVGTGGSAIIAISEDKGKAEKYACEMAARLYAMRHEFKKKLYSVDEIIGIAERNTSGKPVILNDFADSSNAGAAGDSAEVIKRIIELKSDIRALMYINDAEVADLCHKLGAGSTITTDLGAKKSKSLYTPARINGVVKAVFDGIMSMGHDHWADMGPSAVIEVRNTIIIVCHEHRYNGNPRLYRCFGYDPADFDLVVVKACSSFRAFYAPITDLIYPAATKGSASSDLLSFNFTRVPRSFYPFSDSEFTPAVSAWGRQN